MKKIIYPVAVVIIAIAWLVTLHFVADPPGSGRQDAPTHAP